jgi:hypothetical protein
VELVGHIGGATWAVAAQGNYAYVGEGPRLAVLDISDPTAPVKVGETSPLSGVIQDIAAAGDYVYAAGGYSYYAGLHIINVADPSAPATVGFYDAPGSRDVAVAGNYGYVANGSEVLRVVDVSIPTTPTEVGFYKQTSTSASRVDVAGGYAYVAAGDEGLRIVDVSTPSDPTEVGHYDTPGVLTT